MKNIILVAIITLSSITAMAQTRYVTDLYKTTMPIKYFTYINDAGDLKYYKTDTIFVTQTGSYPQTYDKKSGYWLSTTATLTTFHENYRYYMAGKEVFPVDVVKKENWASGWSWVKRLSN